MNPTLFISRRGNRGQGNPTSRCSHPLGGPVHCSLPGRTPWARPGSQLSKELRLEKDSAKSCLTLATYGLWPAKFLCPWDSPGKSTGVGCHILLQRIFPTQGSHPSLQHCRQILYQVSYSGSPQEAPGDRRGSS